MVFMGAGGAAIWAFRDGIHRNFWRAYCVAQVPMIISRRRRFIFVHIPKTGGTSLALASEGRAAADDILIGDAPKAKRRQGQLKDLNVPGRLWKHSTLWDVEGLEDPVTFIVFTIVRNLWDRMVSY